MSLDKEEFKVEEGRLAKTIAVIRKKISELGSELYDREEKVLEFKKFLWDAKSKMDPYEMRTLMSDNDVEVSLMMNKGEYLQKLFRIQESPYFGSIIFEDDLAVKEIYIGITHVISDDGYLVYDWRSPICSMFYDFEQGRAWYVAPAGIIYGEIKRKRQYTIKEAKLLYVFDNNINIVDELLQEVLATESSSKMKNIVNTIQQEQNQVIRNVSDRNLIVQGIAGSGKTSVALHRIAFLLYRIDNLRASNVLIFSPNGVFLEYISNVLPELGESNTMQTTFSKLMESKITEFKEIESFTSFIGRYYKGKLDRDEIISYKQSDEIIGDIDRYVNYLEENICFVDDIVSSDFCYTKDELNYMFRERYNHFSLFRRLFQISEKICDRDFLGKRNKRGMVYKRLVENLNMKVDYKNLYKGFFESEFCKLGVMESAVVNKFVRGKSLKYEDACLFCYLKCRLDGYDYNTSIREIVIDEAQDYTRLQFIIIKNLFRNSNFTILGDVNQTINPYYMYNSLEEIKDIFEENRYIELLKTYRSSAEIIDYTNKILGLNHVSAIRRSNNREILFREESDLVRQLSSDLKYLKKFSKSIAIIVKNDEEVMKIYNLFKGKMDISKIDGDGSKYNRELVVIPSYVAKGLEFDSVIIYTDKENRYSREERYLYYVACTRAQHQLIIYNQEEMKKTI